MPLRMKTMIRTGQAGKELSKPAFTKRGLNKLYTSLTKIGRK
jgi:hypothetical protein